MVVILCHIVLCFSQHQLGFLEGVFHPIREFINRFNAGRRLMQFEAHLRVSAGIEEEGCLLCGRVDVVIVGELRQGEECVPVVLSFSDKDPQVLFQFLVDPFRLSVGLQVVSGVHRSPLESDRSPSGKGGGGKRAHYEARTRF